MSYEDQLKDSRWYYVRDRVLERDKWKCQKCGSWYHLQVHHLRYEKGKMAWEYMDSDLLTLCDKCHKEVHIEQGTIKENPWDAIINKLSIIVPPWRAFINRGKFNGKG